MDIRTLDGSTGKGKFAIQLNKAARGLSREEGLKRKALKKRKMTNKLNIAEFV